MQPSEERLKELVAEAGGDYKGIQKGMKPGQDLVLFNDPVTETTVACTTTGITTDKIRAKLWKSRRLFEQSMPPKITPTDLAGEVRAIKLLAREVFLSDKVTFLTHNAYELQEQLITRLEVLEKYLGRR